MIGSTIMSFNIAVSSHSEEHVPHSLVQPACQRQVTPHVQACGGLNLSSHAAHSPLPANYSLAAVGHFVPSRGIPSHRHHRRQAFLHARCGATLSWSLPMSFQLKHIIGTGLAFPKDS
jgi:hypothetical protein